jgi:ribosomal protein S18 acetylase RimI-like enzyme
VRVVDLVPQIRRPEVRELVSLSVGYPTPEKMDRVLRRYTDDPTRHLIGFERAGSLDGLDGYVGFEIHGDGSGTIWNIAVQPIARRQGLGRAIVRWLIDVAGLTHLTAETDNNAVGFYRRLGFTITSLGDERYPGTERFHCQLDAAVAARPGQGAGQADA